MVGRSSLTRLPAESTSIGVLSVVPAPGITPSSCSLFRTEMEFSVVSPDNVSLYYANLSFGILYTLMSAEITMLFPSSSHC